MNYTTEIREAFGKKYVKVFVRNSNDIESAKLAIEQIDSVYRVNITESQSGGNFSQTLTIYPKKTYTAEEVERDVQTCLSNLNLNNPIIEQSEKSKVISKLDCCPESKKLFNQALEKYNKGGYERNTLDDMRLSLELFLKKQLGNNQSLENQIRNIGKYQKERGRSSEFTNMFKSLLDYYSKYQNEHVKHNDKVNQEEMRFIIKLTSDFIDCF